MRPEDKLQFDKAADVFDLDRATRDRAWRRMTDLGITPNDPYSIFIVTSGVLEKAADIVTASNGELPARIEQAAAKAVGPIAKAAAQQAAADLDHMAADAAATLTKSVKAGIAEASQVQRTRLGLQLIGGALAVALVGGLVGWAARGSSNVGTAAQFTALAQRPDAASWLRLAAANSDLDASLRHYCAQGSERVRSTNGARFCEMAFWLEGAPAPAASSTVQGVYYSVTDKLAAWGPYWLLGLGLLAGLLGRKLIRSTFSWRPLKWLVD